MSGHSIELRNKCDKEKCRFHCNHLACSAELAMEVGEVEEATVVQEALEELSREARELYLGGLPGPGGVHQARLVLHTAKY